jgi:hypothetical protein
MKELHTEIEIRASAERVWQLLTDFEKFPEWNPFLRRASGRIAVGARLKVFLQPPGARGITMKPKVIRMEPPRELRWLGHLFIPGLFDGEHIFIIEALGPGLVRFIQREVFSGILVPLFSRMLDKDTKRGFLEMNNALKTRAEMVG